MTSPVNTARKSVSTILVHSNRAALNEREMEVPASGWSPRLAGYFASFTITSFSHVTMTETAWDKTSAVRIEVKGTRQE